LGRLAKAGAAVLILAAPAYLLITNFQKNNLREFFDARVYGENILRGLPDRSVLVVDGDNETFITGYLQLAQGKRPDVTIVHRKGYLFEAPDYLTGSSRQDLPQNIKRWQREILDSRREVYYATYTDLAAAGDWRLEREGIIFKAVRQNMIRPAAGSNATGRPDRSFARPIDRSRAWLVSCDLDILARQPGQLDFIVRKFAIGYLQSRWDFDRAVKPTGRIDHLLVAIKTMGYDFAQARYLIGFELEKQGRYWEACDEYLAAARLDPQSPFPRQALDRLSGMKTAASSRLSGM